MDARFRELERQAAAGDKSAEMRLQTERARLDPVEKLGLLHMQQQAFMLESRKTFLEILESMVHTYPIFGFTYETKYFDDMADFSICAHMPAFDFDFDQNWYIGYPDRGIEEDIECWYEVIAETEEEGAKKLVNQYGESAHQFLEALRALRCFRKYLIQFSPEMLAAIVGATDWAYSSINGMILQPTEIVFSSIALGCSVKELAERREQRAKETEKRSQEQKAAKNVLLEKLTPEEIELLVQEGFKI